MKLYHGTPCRFNVGDFLSVDKSSGKTICATSDINVAINYSLRWIYMMPEKYKDIVIYHDFTAHTILLGSLYNDIYVYEINPYGFSLKENSDVWTSKSDAQIIKTIRVTPQMLSDAGYDVRKVKGGRLLKKILFRLARMNFVNVMKWHDPETFYKYIDLFTDKYQSEKVK